MLKIKKIRPMFNRVLTTMAVYDSDTVNGGVLIKTKGTVKEYQRVIAVGSTVTSVKPGDLVCINPIRYAVMKHEDKSMRNGIIDDNMVVKYNFPVVAVGDEDCLMLFDQDIDYVVTDYEEVPDSSLISNIPLVR